MVDLIHISPRRVAALAWLAIKESIRRRVVVVFAVFILILLFAGWFLDPGSIDPARLYLGFVLTATSYLVLLLALFLSSLSLPADIKNRTLHTIVTKPVRASEVVLGRIVGFTAVATCLLVLMGAISYVFVERGLAHTHQLTADDLQPVEGAVPGRPVGLQGHTSRVNQHRHKVFIDSAGHGRVEMEQGHTARVDGEKAGRQGRRTSSARRKGCSWPACPSTENSPSATAPASPPTKGSTWATSGPTAATSRAGAWPRPCGPSRESPRRSFPTACPSQ